LHNGDYLDLGVTVRNAGNGLKSFLPLKSHFFCNFPMADFLLPPVAITFRQKAALFISLAGIRRRPELFRR